MNINSIGTSIYGKKITLLSKNNPFKKGSLQYYLVSYVIQHCSTIHKHYNDVNNKKLLDFLSTKKEAFYIDSWNGGRLFDVAINLSLLHNIIKIGKIYNTPSFGFFAEDGLFDVLKEPKFINHLSKGAHISENMKLLWLSLYMNQKIKKDNSVPGIQFNHSNFSYTEQGFNISIAKVPYNKIFESTLEIPLAAFSDSWHSNDWISLNSRGLFHHIGDHVGFYYGASSVGHCYFLGRNQYNHLVTLSSPKSSSVENVDPYIDYYKLFSHVHPSDFVYVYGVPKGNPYLFDNPLIINSEEEDCQMNSTKNVLAAEHFWDNSVFIKNSQRKMFVGDLEDKFKDILQSLEDILTPEQFAIAQRLGQNQPIYKNELIQHQLTNNTCPEDLKSKILKKSSFFMKSLAHKTVCELINPIEDLELGFFMKHNGAAPSVKRMFIFGMLSNLFKGKQQKITKPLNKLKDAFIQNYLKSDLDYVQLWSGENKKGYLFSEIVTMRNEYRMFIINNRVVSTSACFRNTVPLNAWQNGRFDPRLVNGHNDQTTHMNRDRVAKYAKFARKFCQEMKQENPDCQNYVLDVAWCDEKQTVVPIEINSISWSGAYQINMHRICASTLKQSFDYNKLYDFLKDKVYYWNKLMEDNIISPKMFELGGLDRTLKAGTLPDLQQLIDNAYHTIEQRLNPVVLENTEEELNTTSTPSPHIDKFIEELDEMIELDDDDLDEDDDFPLDEESKEK